MHEVLHFEDPGGDMFQSMLNRKQLENLDLRVTDGRGRSLAFYGPDQALDGNLAFRACLRWDLFIFKAPPPLNHGVKGEFLIDPLEM